MRLFWKLKKKKNQKILRFFFTVYKDESFETLKLQKQNNIEMMIYDKADEVIEERFGSFLERYQFELETVMKGSGFIFDCVP